MSYIPPTSNVSRHGCIARRRQCIHDHLRHSFQCLLPCFLLMSCSSIPLEITAQSFIANLQQHRAIVCKTRRGPLDDSWLTRVTHCMENQVVNPEIRYEDGLEVVPEAFFTIQTVHLEDPYNRQDPQVVECSEEKEVCVKGCGVGREVHVREYAQGRQSQELVNHETSHSLLKRFRKQICVAVAVIGSVIIIAVVVAVVEVKNHRRVANTTASSTSSVTTTSGSIALPHSSTSSSNVSIVSSNSSISSNVSSAPSNSFTSSINVSISTSDAYNGTGLV